jgi:succinate dehydrogenase / fumarate reductase, cytochrome b subunit
MPMRPLSPYLSVYKMTRYTLATSIFNRFTGVGLSAGLLLLVYWLMAVAGGARTQARAMRLLALPVMKLVYAGLIVAFCYHLVAGIRHLVWDTGRGLERAQSRRSAWLVGVVSLVLMLVLAYCAGRAAAGPP